MKKESYIAIIEREFGRTMKSKQDDFDNSVEGKSLIKERDEIRTRLNIIDKKLSVYAPYQARDKLQDRIKTFIHRWDEMTLIVDTKKRNETKIQLLKDFNLYR